METLTLEWHLKNQHYRYTFTQASSTKATDKLRIGRDPAQCDIVLPDRSVSSLHVEIFFTGPRDAALIQNLRPSNPPLINGYRLTTTHTTLAPGSELQLGYVQLRVTELVLPGQVKPAVLPRQPSVQQVYGLKCPNPVCGKVSEYNEQMLKQGCPWCGFSLAAANTVMVTPPAT